MVKRITKSLGIFFAVGLLMALLFVTASAKTVVVGDFKFDVTSKAATLVEYTGKEKSVKIPSKVDGVTVTKIADEAFWQKSTMTSVSIPSGVTSIGEAAFNECTGLTEIVLPSKLKTLGDSAFWYCKNLKSVVIPETVKKMGNNSFKGCSKKLTAYVVEGTYGEKYVKNRSESIKLGYRYASSIKLSDTSLKIEVGDTAKLKATLSPSVLYNSKVKFTSDNKAVVKVSSSGKLVPVSCGTALITVAAQDGSGKKATCKVTVIPSDVGEITQTDADKTSVTIKWTKSEGSSRQILYRYDSQAKKWVKITTTTKSKYTVKDLPLDSTTKIRVRGYMKTEEKTYYGEYSYIYVSTLSPARVENLKALTVSDTEVKLTWDEAANASGYKVYIYDAQAQKYDYIGKTTSLSYTADSLKADTQYTFAVRSYISESKKTAECKEYSEHADALTALGRVSGLKADEVSFSKAVLSWGGVEGATGYEVSVGWGEGSDTIKTADTSLELTKLESNTEYTFCVRAYKESPENYGEYSDEVKAKTKDIPTDAQSSIDAFGEALENTANYGGQFTVFEQINQTAEAEGFDSVTASLTQAPVNTYYFEGGKTDEGIDFDGILSKGGELNTDSIVEGSVECTENGSGYEITFLLVSDDTGDIASTVTPLPDWQRVAEENEGFELTKCTYTYTRVTVKVQDGRFSYIITETVFEADFTLGDEAGSLEGENVRRLGLIYW